MSDAPGGGDDIRWPWLRRLSRWLTPTSPGDWRRFTLLAANWVVSFLLISLVLARVSDDDVDAGLSGLLPIGGYSWLASSWWRLYFQEVAKPAGRGPDGPTLRRWLVRGRTIWIALAYVVVLGQAVASGSGGSGDDDDGGWVALLFLLALPFGLAWLAALVGRYMAEQTPARR